MYVFGIDIPLVEFFLIITIFFAIMFVMLVYTIFEIIRINRRLRVLMKEEAVELRDLRALRKELDEIRDETGKDMQLLAGIRKELDEILKDEREEMKDLKALMKLKRIGRKVGERIKKRKPAAVPELWVKTKKGFWKAQMEAKPKLKKVGTEKVGVKETPKKIAVPKK